MTLPSVAAALPSGGGTAAFNMSFTQAVNVWLLHWQGARRQEIATRLGTNAMRVEAVLQERQHVGSQDRARSMVTPRRRSWA